MTIDRAPHADVPVLDALHSTPSRRYLADTPIPDEVIWALLDAAVRGPTGGNRQAWGWVVVTERAVKEQVAVWYREAWQDAYGWRRAEILSAGPASSGMDARTFRAAAHLAAHVEEAPVWVFAVLRDAAESTNPRLGASIYGAVQHLVLAARAFGIGTTLTTFHAGHEAQVARLLGLPPDALTMALLPLGYPERGRWVEPRRRPLEDVVHWERWGSQRTRQETAARRPAS